MDESLRRQVAKMPERYALAIAATYLVLGSAYIMFSGRMVSSMARSVSDLARLETLKGWAFIFVTALGLYAFSRALLQRIATAGLVLAKQEQAYQLLDRRALAGTLASAVAHDSNNLLQLAKMTAEELLARPEPEVRALATDLDAAVDDLIERMRRLRDLGSQSRASELREVDLGEEIERIVQRVRKHAAVRGCDVAVVHPEPLPLRIRPILIDELTTNLVLNAGEAGARTIRVEVERHDDGARLSVSDDGPGIPPDQRDKIFEPFFTTKAEGTGLGLLSVRGCADAHHGAVTVGPSTLGGARFVVTLRAADAQPRNSAATSSGTLTST